jgi:uncharacterized protein YndB with AHSA1/START domain
VKITYAVHIEAPVEEVFELLRNPEKADLWMDGLEENTFPPGADYPVGTRFRRAVREAELLAVYEGEVTAYERPTHLGIRLSSRRLSVDVDYRLSPDRGGTRAVYSADLRLRSWIERLATRLLRHLTEGVVRNQMWKLKRVAESGGEPVPPPKIDFGW